MLLQKIANSCFPIVGTGSCRYD